MSDAAYITIPLKQFRMEMLAYSERFLREIGDNVSQSISGDDCDKIVMSLIEEYVDQHALWRKHVASTSPVYNHVVDEIFQHSLPDDIRNHKEKLAVIRDEYYRAVIDPIWTKVRHIIRSVIYEDTWNIWWIKKMNHSIILEKGIDFRVHDWESRMSSGTWQ